MRSILELSPEDLKAWMQEHGFPAYRARQLTKWLFGGRVTDFDSMTDLPEGLRQHLKSTFALWQTEVVRSHQDPDGTEKLVLQLVDGGRIECVMIREGSRRTICISTQVGCAMGCVFCASGLDGVDRNLTSGEIIEQVLRLQQLLPASERISNIVVMGMGEPLANLSQLLVALEAVTSQDGLGISTRRVTISTVGLPEAIRRLAQQERHYQLAVSLHAPDDELRNQLIPTNSKTGVEAILAASDYFFETTRRRVTYEYVLLADINDQPKHAHALVSLLKSRAALLNVIPYNPVKGLPYETPSKQATSQFGSILQDGGLNVQFRLRKGDSINAACGQLRRGSTGTDDTLVTLE
jgi:23S rRNA (adenine2503-C2)-methyltransferase